MSFLENAESMGLVPILDNSSFKHEDEYSKVMYRRLVCKDNGEEIPRIALFTSPSDKEDYQYVTTLSNSYQFVANDSLIQSVKQSINEIGSPIFDEQFLMSPSLSMMILTITIKNEKSIDNVGTLYPCFRIRNSYDGSCAACVSFGISLEDSSSKTLLNTMLTKIFGQTRQIHLTGSSTYLSSQLKTHVQVFNSRIEDLLQANLNRPVTEEHMMEVLHMIEKCGKKRKDIISSDILPEQGGPVSTWDVFHAILRYSTIENNLNIKVMLENIAQTVLYVPQKMFEVVEKLKEVA